jgi:hypothetical protein
MLTSILFIPHHRHPRGRHHDTQLTHSRQATRMYISRPSTRRGGHRSSHQIISFFSFYHLFLRAFFLRLGDRPVEPLSTRSRPISPIFALSQFSLSFPLSLDLGRHFHPCTTYLRYSAATKRNEEYVTVKFVQLIGTRAF